MLKKNTSLNFILAQQLPKTYSIKSHCRRFNTSRQELVQNRKLFWVVNNTPYSTALEIHSSFLKLDYFFATDVLISP